MNLAELYRVRFVDRFYAEDGNAMAHVAGTMPELLMTLVLQVWHLTQK